jgi:hypothetical protein
VKKITFLIVTLFIFLFGIPAIGLADENVSIVLNGNILKSDISPQVVNGRTLVPVRVISEALGMNVGWNNNGGRVTITKDQTNIQLTINNSSAMVGDKMVTLDQPPIIVDGRTLVPLRFISESLGINVGWEPLSKTILITSPFSVKMNDQVLPNNAKVYLLGSMPYIPLSPLSQPLNLTVDKNESSGTVNISANGNSFSMNIAGADINSHQNAMTIDGDLYVPLSSLRQLGMQAVKAVDQNVINLTKPVIQDVSVNSTTSQSAPSSFSNGTYLFIWKADQLDNGDVTTMIQDAKLLGVKGVIIKFANGSVNGDEKSQQYMDQFKKLVGPFKNAGFSVGGWIYQYLTDVNGEVDACSQAVQAGADFIVLDGEGDLSGKNAQVTQFGQLFRAKYPHFPLALSSFAIADYHPEVPYTEYSQFVDAMMPQIYWGEMGRSVTAAFQPSIASYQKFNKPIFPTGQLYTTTSQDKTEFIQLCKNAGISSVSWWDWDEATKEDAYAIRTNNFLVASN